ncbi:excisionase [Roseixanthobacter liquoris]|uniref:excisionase n=1 Tax=Roseixanthobacter liquoris TaxID=3119921 RepID=UPI003726C128
MRSTPSRDQITDTTPLRLGVAAALAFPDGSITASSLRRESLKGRLTVERIANKDYTTLKAIEDMRLLCRVQPKEAGPAQPRPAAGRISPGSDPSSPLRVAERKAALDALMATAKMLNESSQPPTPKNANSPHDESTVSSKR